MITIVPVDGIFSHGYHDPKYQKDQERDKKNNKSNFESPFHKLILWFSTKQAIECNVTPMFLSFALAQGIILTRCCSEIPQGYVRQIKNGCKSKPGSPMPSNTIRNAYKNEIRN